MQTMSIRPTTICPEAHWQNGKIERHGRFLQEMLVKMDLENSINDYQTLAMATGPETVLGAFKFKQMPEFRESARRAFHSVDSHFETIMSPQRPI